MIFQLVKNNNPDSVTILSVCTSIINKSVYTAIMIG